MHIINAIIGALLAIFGIIILHEFGHYFMARALGVKVLRFSIGFGKPLWKYLGKRGTEYAIGWLPLGGYVRMLGEKDEITAPEEAHQAFNQKPLLSRMLIVLAGPIVNLCLAVIAYWGVYLMGVVQILPTVGSVTAHSIAAQAGFHAGDQIIKVDGTSATNWSQVVLSFIKHAGSKEPLVVTVRPQNAHALQHHSLDLSHWKIDQRKTDLFESLGIQPGGPAIPPLVASVQPHSPAAEAGLKPGDKITALDHHPISDWMQLQSYVQNHPNQIISLEIRKGDHTKMVTLKTGVQNEGKKSIGYLGITPVPPSNLAPIHYSIFSAWVPAFRQVYHLLLFNGIVIVKMILGKISVHTLGGPITLFQTAGQASQAGFQVYLAFIGFMSLTIGFINLLPIPGLDGGHLLFQLVEAILRRPIPERIQFIGLSLGLLFLIFLMVEATINDLARLFF